MADDQKPLAYSPAGAYLRLGLLILLAISPCLVCGLFCNCLYPTKTAKQYARLEHGDLVVTVYSRHEDIGDPASFYAEASFKGVVINPEGWFGTYRDRPEFRIVDLGDGMLAFGSTDAPKAVYFCLDEGTGKYWSSFGGSNRSDEDEITSRLKSKGYVPVDYNSRSVEK